MDATYRSNRRTTDLLSVVTAAAGLAGSFISAALWLYQMRRARVSVPIELLLGALALSYPVLAMLQVVQVPVHVVLFR
jgi:hypothetical protein